MKTTLFCLIIALILRGAFDGYVTAQECVTSPKPVTTVRLTRPWDGTQWFWMRDVEGRAVNPLHWNPSYTDIVVEYKPIVKKLGTDRYEITFTSEIAENLP